MGRTRKIFAILVTAYFLFWISLFILNEPVQFYKETKISKSENRNLTKKPFFDILQIDPYPKAYEAFFNDHFIFRPQLLRFNTLFNFFLFHKSPSPKDVAVGKDGWFFLSQKEKQVFTGKYTLSNNQILDIAEDLKQRAYILDEAGIKFYVAFAPMKQNIYPEFLPSDYVHCSTGTVTEKISVTIRKMKGVTLIDLEKPLLAAKKYGRIYNKTDNHWNRFGAYFAYKEIAGRIKEDFPGLKIVQKSEISFRDTVMPSGNLATMMDLADYFREIDPVPYLKHSRVNIGKKVGYKPPNSGLGDSFEIVRETNDPSLPKVLVIRDSFTNALMPFLDETFRKTVYIFDGWQYDDNKVIVDNEKPDIVLLIIFEPHISHLIHVP
jgi:alginate O-acetyltransferase complex protein AlgJ